MTTHVVKQALAALLTTPRSEREKLTDAELDAAGLTRDDLDFDTESEADIGDSDDGDGNDSAPLTRDNAPESSEAASSKSARTRILAREIDSKSDAEWVDALKDDAKALLAYLDEVNGQDAYSNTDAALGKVTKREFLVLPTGFVIPDIKAADVGSPTIHVHFAKRDLANIYALNKEAAPNGIDAKRFAMIRMEAVKMGWVAGQKEIRRADPPADAKDTFLKDLGEEKDSLTKYRRAAFLIPLVAEHTFRTMGHHYLTGDATTYDKRYRDTFRACLADEVPGILPPGVQYHALLHWVSPQRARDVLVAQLSTPRIPDALALRANAAPAGTALVTTTAAVLSTMRAANLYNSIASAGDFDFAKIESVTRNVKANPTGYHKTYYAYGLRALTTTQRNELESAKLEAARFAPVAQAFIEAMFQDSALSNAKALKKHANDNPVLMKRAQRFFRALSRQEAKTVADLFTKEAQD